MVSNIQDGDKEKVREFLQSLRIKSEEIAGIWDPGTSDSPRRRIACYMGEKIIGVAAWDAPNKLEKETKFFLFVEETAFMGQKVVDHFFEKILQDATIPQIRRIFLRSNFRQSFIAQTAVQKGFRQLGKGNFRSLTKISFKGVIQESNWDTFSKDFLSLSGFTLPSKIPSYQELKNTGIFLKRGREQARLSLLEFETLISPAFLMCKHRSALIIPIKIQYAEKLLPEIYDSSYFRIETQREELLHIERAYFRKPSKVGYFKEGEPIIFYVSGEEFGAKQAVGMARITYSAILPIEEIEIRLSRQGVLSKEELEDNATNNQVHVFTFDNYIKFPSNVSFRNLKKWGCVSEANLITAEEVSSQGTQKLIQHAFQ